VLHERKARLAEGHVTMSSGRNDIPSAPGRVPGQAPRVGAELRGAREYRGWELEALAASLRIRSLYLEAIEDGRVADLPGNAYALGFLRTYAATLGLDADDIARRFRAEVAEVNTKTELTFPAPVPDRGVPAGVVVVLGLVLAIGAYVGWYTLADRAAPPNPVMPVPERLARLADPTALTPPHPPVPARPTATVSTPAATGITVTATNASRPASSMPASVPAAPPGSVAIAAVKPPAVTQPAVTQPAATPPGPATPAAAVSAVASPMAPPVASSVASPVASPAAPGVSAASNAALAAVSSLAPPANAATQPLPPPGTIIVRATAAAWIEVRDSTGTVVFTKLMQPGESWTVPRQAGLVLTTGNAGGTELIVDGRPAPPLGGPGMVVRGQPLDAALIKAGALPAQIAAAAGTPAYTPASIHATQGADPTQ